MRQGTLPTEIAALFEAIPQNEAMPALIPAGPKSGEAFALAEAAIREASDPAVQAGIWLYVDDLDRSHRISQGLDDETGAFWHGIMHRREGDFSNAKYWFRRARNHPAMALIEGYDPYAFVDQVAESPAENPENLVDLQRREWSALFTWCAERA